ncbi:MAG: S8 family serine peptidase, partial [candidate division Zixibacteria bacterium]|nr:S8 family serine peptidase [candidate division Zixibacteria bacterium]
YQIDRKDSRVDVVVFMERDSSPVSVSARQDGSTTRDARIRSVLGDLKNYRSLHDDQVEDVLIDYSSTVVIRHWVVPAFSATIPLSRVEAVADLSGVRLVVEDMELNFDPPVEVYSASSSSVVSDQLTMLNVPYLWHRGLKGSGRLVCSFDTGVEQNHPALADKWRGNHTFLEAAWFSPTLPDTIPVDRTGHGTHTMGIMVGAAPADSFGVAPEAEWITAGVIDQGRPLATTLSDIIQAFQWALNPDDDTSTTSDVPDVILNSWGIPKGLFEPCDDTFSEVIDAVEAAGIVTIFAAGNEGPGPATLRSPADHSATPLNSFAVGAVGSGKLIAEFSSRGPSSCDSRQIKPEMVAPGIGIRSSTKGGAYAVMSGTSMAAPYIAGLVTLMRQYNPDATVKEIKNALIGAAVDLGSPGEDNSYGYGFVDASKLLDYMPVPSSVDINVKGVQVSDDGFAWPGEGFGLQLELGNVAANVETVIGRIEASSEEGVSIVEDEVSFFFGVHGTSAVNFTPYEIVFDSSLSHGQIITFSLYLRPLQGDIFDTASFEVTVGVKPGGSIASQNTSRIDFSVSDFGQYGFAPGSIYSLGGEGFSFDGCPNLLYEAGIILGRNSLQLSSSIRDSVGQFRTSDFSPTELLTDIHITDDGGAARTACFEDIYSSVPIPINVMQEVISYEDESSLLIFKYFLKNSSLDRITNLYFGFLADFDMPGDGESIVFDEGASLLYQDGTDGPLVGLVDLKNVTSFRSLDNGIGKTGFTHSELFELISFDGIDVKEGQGGDLMFVVSSGPFAIDPYDSVEVAVALVAASDLVTLFENADRARSRYDMATSVENDYSVSLPEAPVLHQNYPNPFNPTTTISFSLPMSNHVSLVVYNALGQKVTELFSGRLPAGEHSIQWDATNDRGQPVASGAYFYRLISGDVAHSRKMLLLK